MESSSLEFLNMSIGMLSLPFDFPAGMCAITFSSSSSVNGFVSISFSSTVNFGRFNFERNVSMSSSEQVSLFWNKDFK